MQQAGLSRVGLSFNTGFEHHLRVELIETQIQPPIPLDVDTADL